MSKIKVKLYFQLIKYHTCETVEVKLHALLASVPDGSGWSALPQRSLIYSLEVRLVRLHRRSTAGPLNSIHRMKNRQVYIYIYNLQFDLWIFFLKGAIPLCIVNYSLH